MKEGKINVRQTKEVFQYDVLHVGELIQYLVRNVLREKRDGMKRKHVIRNDLYDSKSTNAMAHLTGRNLTHPPLSQIPPLHCQKAQDRQKDGEREDQHTST